jgi:hypothetical protein
LCAFFKSRKDKGPWQVAGLTRDYNQAAIWFYLIKWSLYYHFTDLSQTLNWKLWDVIPCVFICSEHFFPSSRSSLPSAQALPVSQVWEHLNFPSHISLCASTIRFTTFDLESWSPLAMVSLANYCQKTHLF